MFIKVLLCTIFGLYLIGVAINAYLKFDWEDIDWEDIGKQVEEDLISKTTTNTEVNTEIEEQDNSQLFSQSETERIEEWAYVQYPNKKKKPKTGKDLTLEINE